MSSTSQSTENDPKANSSDHRRFVVATTVAFFVPLLIYIMTAARTITFEDAGLFLLVAKYKGLAHPPGYPLYTWLSYLFSLLPVGELAFRVALLSAVLGASASTLIFLLLNRLIGRIRLALPAALIVAFSETVWGQMIVAEVYALNFFLLVAFFYLLIDLRKHFTDKKLWLLGVVCGLALSNHWPIFGLTVPAFLLLSKRHFWRPRPMLMVFGTGLGIATLFYLEMYFRSKTDPYISFMGPIANLHELVRYVLRSYYSQTDKSVLFGIRDVMQFLGYFVQCLTWQDFVPLVAPLALAGIYAKFKREGHDRLEFYSWLYLLFSTSGILLLFLHLEYNDLNRNIFHVFWLGPFLAFGVFAVYGAEWLEKRWQNAGMFALILALAVQVFVNFGKNNLREDRLAAQYGEVVLKSVPDNSVLVASTDGDVGPIAYTHDVLGIKPSVKLYTGQGVLFRDRIFDPLLQSSKQRLQISQEFVRSKGVVFSVKQMHVFQGIKEPGVKSSFNGITYKYTPFEEPKTEVPDDVLPLAEKALTDWLNGPDLENFKYHRETLLSRLCNYIILRGNETHPVYEKSPGCMQVKARHLAATGRREEADRVYQLWFKKIQYPVVTEKQEYFYHFLVNRLEWINSIKGNPDQQIRLLQEGLDIVEVALTDFPLCENLVAPLVKSIKSPVPLKESMQQKLRVFDSCPSKS